jgi:hypothetical protein
MKIKNKQEINFMIYLRKIQSEISKRRSRYLRLPSSNLMLEGIMIMK